MNFDIRAASQFLMKGSLSLVGVVFVAYQFTFANFAKVELDAIKLKVEVEEARGEIYSDFDDMVCLVKPKETKTESKSKETPAKPQAELKTAATEGKTKDGDSNGKSQEAEKPNPTHYIEYAKCALAKATKKQVESVLSLASEFESTVFLLAGGSFFIGLVGYGISCRKTNDLPNNTSQKATDEEEKPKDEEDKGEVDTKDQQPEVPKSSPEGTDEEEAKQEKDK